MKKDQLSASAITGIYRASGKGYGFVVPEAPDERSGDLFIPPHKEHGAWSGDRVAAVCTETDAEGRTAGKIVQILERANRRVVGTLARMGRSLYLVPDSDKLPSAIQVAGKPKGAHADDKAAVSMVTFGGRDGTPMGTLAESFGPAGSRETSTAAILYENEIDPAFPPPYWRKPIGFPDTVPPEALAGRLDLREQCIITIDGASSKDFDDAVSLSRDGQGRPVLGSTSPM